MTARTNTTNLISCSTKQIAIVNVNYFMEAIMITGICKILQHESSDKGFKMVFDDDKEIEITKGKSSTRNIKIVIEVYNIQGLCLTYLGNRVNRNTISGPLYFKVSGVSFEIREIPKPDQIEFEFEGKKYTVDIKAFYKDRIQLPDGRVLIVGWDKSSPYKPINFSVSEFPQAKFTNKEQDTYTFTMTKYIDVNVHEIHTEHLSDGRKLIVETHIE